MKRSRQQTKLDKHELKNGRELKYNYIKLKLLNQLLEKHKELVCDCTTIRKVATQPIILKMNKILENSNY